ncbi:MAG: hypothetical protein HYZ42_15545 [Bacteroidetes bacterium]|nr:hypothetical protein [Bacteroidota bacterium]
MKKSINTLISFVRSYIKVGVDEKNKIALNLDVEGFISSLQNLPYNKFRPIQFNLTVGTNTSYFQKNLMTATDTLRNYSYIGEKIGIKFKLYDYKYINSFSKGETYKYYGKSIYRTVPAKEPAISNIHILAYGSGILYNLANTGTSKGFNSPLVGLGFGITFFNDLDFNLSVGQPILSNKGFMDASVPYFFNIGFDIQFIEYYNKLNTQRNNNQTQKKLAKAQNYRNGSSQ